MDEQRMVPVELLEDLLEFLLCHSNRWDGFTKPPQLIAEQARAIIDEPGVEPFAYYVYFPDAQDGEFCEDLDDLIDRLTNERHEVTPLYCAAPSAPAQAVPDGSTQP